MGNRAHVIFVGGDTISPAVYLHWNGGPESVYAFLDELDARHVRADGSYEAARFVQIVGEFFDQDGRGGMSLGVTNGPVRITRSYLAPYEHGDAGVYVVSRVGGKRVVRRFVGGELGVRELDEQAVEVERKAAYRHPYHGADGIPAFFQKTRGKVAA